MKWLHFRAIDPFWAPVEDDFAVFLNGHHVSEEQAIRFPASVMGNFLTRASFILKMELVGNVFTLFLADSVVHSQNTSNMPLRNTDQLYAILYIDNDVGFDRLDLIPISNMYKPVCELCKRHPYQGE